MKVFKKWKTVEMAIPGSFLLSVVKIVTITRMWFLFMELHIFNGHITIRSAKIHMDYLATF